jgi:O-antigen biosynthesis protein WbqV
MGEDELAASVLDRPLLTGSLEPLRKAFSGRRVLVTGGGGYIGAGLVRLVAGLGAARVVIMENGEHALYSIDAELARSRPDLSRRALYCDIRDAAAVSACFAEEQPHIVLHAAALKQLPLLEGHPREAFLTNTIGVRNVARAAAATGAAAMLLISTDKAVRASSALGATKRLAEDLCRAMDAAGGATRFTSVRFGNVFGSTGSVVPLFRRQIAEGGPVTVTDAQMTRYFMTREEACRLVLAATALALDGASSRGDVFVLEPGEPVSITEIARRLIASSGRGGDIPITVVGARDGEHLSEILVGPRERVMPSGMDGIVRVSSDVPPPAFIQQRLLDMEAAARAYDTDNLCRQIEHCVPSFTWRPSAPILSRPAVG